MTGGASALRSSERLTALVLGGLLLLDLWIRPEGWLLRSAVFGGLLASLLLAGQLRWGRGPLWLRDFAPVATVLLIFLLLQPLVAAANPRRWDTVLAALDGRFFGHLGAGWFGAFGRPAVFTDLVYAAYASFYLLPLSVGALCRSRSGRESFEQVVFTILLGFYLSFLGYFLWPAEGPRVPHILAATQLGGGAISQGIRAFLQAAESTTLDAFPSGHTALSLISAALATRFLPRLAPLAWGWALAITFATVYIRVHYVADVAAGILLAGLTLTLAPLLRRWLGPPITRSEARR